MAVIINASTSTGLVQSADTSGIIQFQSNGSTKATLNSSGFSYPGAVLQVVYGTYSTQVSSTSTSYVDTGLSLSITPTSASSKILVSINQYVYMYDISSGIGVSVGFQIVRNSTNIFTSTSKEQFYLYVPNGPTRIDIATNVPLQYLDSPATTSAVTYKTQGALFDSAGNQSVLYQGSNNYSTITLMEIAA